MIIVIIALCFLFTPTFSTQNDWYLNTHDIVGQNYLNHYCDANRVYPPWAVVLLLPLHFLHIEGMRLLSVFIIGWLVYQKKWSLYHFFTIILSPFFIYTMVMCNMDIFTIVLPLILWETVENTRHQTIGRAAALFLFSIKPQTAVLLVLYLCWINRKQLKSILIPAALALLIILPFSLVGSPPLIMQWLHNITHPSPQNQRYWTMNNMSLSNAYHPLIAIGLFALLGLILFLLHKRKTRPIKQEALHAWLIMAALMISPYASAQSLIAATAFLPSIFTLLLEAGLAVILFSVDSTPIYGRLLTFAVFALALILYTQADNPRKAVPQPDQS